MTVQELIQKLEKLPQNLPVVLENSLGFDVETVYIGKWIHTNYPYNKPEYEVVVIG